MEVPQWPFWNRHALGRDHGIGQSKPTVPTETGRERHAGEPRLTVTPEQKLEWVFRALSIVKDGRVVEKGVGSRPGWSIIQEERPII